jgi:hypothetical protein
MPRALHHRVPPAPDRPRSTVTLILVTACALFTPSTVGAVVMDGFAGWEGDNRQAGYGFVGVGARLAAGRYISVPIGVSASYLYYHYDSAGSDVSVRSPGASVMTGIRVTAPRGSISAMAGSEVRWEYRNLGEWDGSPRKRTTSGVVLQTYGDLALARRWQVSEFGVYVGAAQYSVGRAAVRYQVTNLDWKDRTTRFVGLEGVRQGNAVSDAFQTGGFVEWNLVPWQLSLGLHSGYKESWSPGQMHQQGYYLGTSLYRRF